MRMILTSKIFGDDEATRKLRNVCKEDFKNIKILLIATPCLPYGPEKYYDELIKHGFLKENIVIFDHNNSDKYIGLNIDWIYVTGGNTFQGLKIIKEIGFDKEIKKYINNGVMYLGRSAGTHLVTKNIEHVLEFDDNEVNLNNFDALGIFNGIIICHYGEERKKAMERCKMSGKYNTYYITNQEILLVENDEIKKY